MSVQIVHQRSVRLLFNVIFFFGLFFSREILADTYTYPYQISICGIFRDDARFLKEWIEFHRVVGVEHFWLYNNLSKDEYLDVLSTYIEEGIVELIDWPFESQNESRWLEIQVAAYDDCIERSKGLSKWLVVIDTDEFLFPVKDEQLVDILKEFEAFGGVGVNWQMYGTSWVKRIPDNQLMTKLLIRKAKEDYKRNLMIKSIVRPERVKNFRCPHTANYVKNYKGVDMNKKNTNRVTSKKILIDCLRINHYWTRDEDFFIEVKASRRDKPNGDYEKFLKDFEMLNEYEDTSIFKYLEMLKHNMGFEVLSVSGS
jgi:Glycosyltransferase family 92